MPLKELKISLNFSSNFRQISSHTLSRALISLAYRTTVELLFCVILPQLTPDHSTPLFWCRLTAVLLIGNHSAAAIAHNSAISSFDFRKPHKAVHKKISHIELPHSLFQRFLTVGPSEERYRAQIFPPPETAAGGHFHTKPKISHSRDAEFKSKFLQGKIIT